MPLRKSILYILNIVKGKYSSAKFRWAKRFGLIGRVMIVPYKGFGNQKAIYFIGRVIKDKGIEPGKKEDTAWQNIKSMFKRFSSFEVPGVRVQARFYGAEKTVVTDEEGYFDFHLIPVEKIPWDSSWHETELELLDTVVPEQEKVVAKGRIFIPQPEVEYGIISDIDDTILTTDATRWWKMIKITLINNARTRLPFAGVSAFYRALEKGASGNGMNPLFYVSSSPWNLYDLLIDFCDAHMIPKGALMLRDIGLSRESFFASDHATHKLKQIEHIFSIYPELTFILIGDSGQHDPEIYLQVIKDFPGRVKVVYIRDVSKAGRREKMDRIVKELRELGVELLLVKDTVEAAQHAASHQFIIYKEIPSIVVEKELDDK